MSEKCEAKECHIRCDEPGCAWEYEMDFADIPKWHKKPCPKCGNGEIISDSDMVAFRLMVAIIDASNEIDPDGKLPRVNAHVDTRVLRETSTPPTIPADNPCAGGGSVSR
ncbi:MAG: hypothetical protein K9N51_02400 [Candidatus Pacebacteria bacterium]|nr:hypothetical protein [Candidatus Paceibacterota bacterium]